MDEKFKMKKETVLIVHNYYQIPGGEDTVVSNEKRLLEEHGHEVILYSRNNSEITVMSRAQKIGMALTTVFNLRTYREIKKIIQNKHVDIVHVHNTLSLISPSVYYAAVNCNVPVVQTVHNFRLICPGATFYRDGHICEDCVAHGLRCAVKHSCYRGSKIQTLACVISNKFHRLTGIYQKINFICLTKFNRDKLLLLKQINPDRVFVKPNFVGGNIDRPAIEKKHNQFVFAGRLDKLKGIDILLNAWKLMGTDAPKLIICGTGPMEEWCKMYISENHLTSVSMRGFVPNAEVRKIIENAIALILPTQWYEGFPMTIVEALSVGTPVIGSNIGNVGDLLIDDINGWKFRFDSAEDLAEKVKVADERKLRVSRAYINEYLADNNYQMLSRIYRDSI